MSRLMSVTLTEDAVVERRKTVTRRLGWLMLKPGDTLTLCRKVMGRKKGDPLVRLAEVEVVDEGGAGRLRDPHRMAVPRCLTRSSVCVPSWANRSLAVRSVHWSDLIRDAVKELLFPKRSGVLLGVDDRGEDVHTRSEWEAMRHD